MDVCSLNFCRVNFWVIVMEIGNAEVGGGLGGSLSHLPLCSLSCSPTVVFAWVELCVNGISLFLSFPSGCLYPNLLFVWCRNLGLQFLGFICHLVLHFMIPLWFCHPLCFWWALVFLFFPGFWLVQTVLLCFSAFLLDATQEREEWGILGTPVFT